VFSIDYDQLTGSLTRTPSETNLELGIWILVHLLRCLTVHTRTFLQPQNSLHVFQSVLLSSYASQNSRSQSSTRLAHPIDAFWNTLAGQLLKTIGGRYIDVQSDFILLALPSIS